MGVQVQVTWTVVGDDELKLTSSFGYLDPADGDGETDLTAPVERVLDAESSALSPGLAVQVG